MKIVCPRPSRSTLMRINTCVFIFLLVMSSFYPVFSQYDWEVKADPSDVWWHDWWNFRKPITIDHTQFDDDLTDFEFLIEIDDPDLTLKAQEEGYDIVFTDDLGTNLNHEIEFYQVGYLVAWVKIPLISASVDTVTVSYTHLTLPTN